MTGRAGRRGHLAATLIVAVLAVGLSGAAWQAGLLDGVEHSSAEARFTARGAKPPQDVAVVGIDNLTFERLGERWPFPRSLHAKAIDRLRQAGARRIVYDVQFTEPSDPDEDLALYRAVGRARGTILATTEVGPHGSTRVLGGDENLAKAGARAAAANLPEDDKGVLSRISRDNAGLETMAAATAKAEGRPAPWRAVDNDAPIAYRGPAGTIPTIPFYSVVRGQFDPRLVRGKIVVVGATAPTLQDFHPTPAGRAVMAGPEVQANAIWTALHGLPLRHAPDWLDALTILLFGLVAPLAGLRFGLVRVALVSAGAGVLYVAVAQVAFDHGTMLVVVYPLLALVLGFAGAIAARSFGEARERRRVSRYSELLESEVRARTEELRETQFEVVHRLGQAAESRDKETGRHIQRISRMSERLARAVGMSADDAELIGHASALHDVGKIGIPDRVLLKPGKLDDEEWEIMRSHTKIGAQILSGSRSPLVRLAEEIALTHHERWDGTGYPRGLRGEQIPLAGRITSIVDVFDALLSRRSYKERWSLEVALEEVRRQSGLQFDPALVTTFLQIAPGFDDDLLQRSAADQPDDPGDGEPEVGDVPVASEQPTEIPG